MTTIEFNKKLTCGNDFVAVTVIDVQNEIKQGSIWLPADTGSNSRLAFCRVDNVGKNAHEITGIEPGDYVMIDRLATFAWTAPKAALKYDSVIMKTNESKSEFFPLKGSLFVVPDAKKNATEVNGVLVVNYEKRLNLGTIEKTSFEPSDEYPFKPGDRVMLVKGGDVVNAGGKLIHIYKKDMIVCTVEDE